MNQEEQKMSLSLHVKNFNFQKIMNNIFKDKHIKSY